MGILEDIVAQVSQTVAAQQAAPPPTLPVNPTQSFPVQAQPSDIYRINQNLGGMAEQAGARIPQTLPSMVGQATQSPAAQLASVVGTSPRVAPAPGSLAGAVAQPGAAPYSVLSQGPLAPPVAGTGIPAVEVGAGGAARAMEAAPALASTAAGAADDVAAAGVKTWMERNIPSLAGASISKGSLLKGGAVGVAGLMASGWLDARNFGGENSELDQALKGGALGAGVGAGAAIALGLGAGPVGWAALGGAALFAAGNMVFGDNTSTEDKMDQAIEKANGTIDTLIGNPMFGIDPDTAAQIKLQVAATTEFYKNNKDQAGLNQYLAGLAQTVPSFLMEASSRNAANQQKMQMQAAFGPVYSRMVDRSSTAAKQAFDTQMQAAQSVSDPTISAALKTQAAQQYSAQMDTMAAYAQQIAGTPQNLKPSQQAVVDNTQSLMQQAMGMGLTPAGA